MIGAIYCGTVTGTTPRSVHYGWFAPFEAGFILLAANVQTSARHTSDTSNFWRLDIGTTHEGKFTTIIQAHMSGGLLANRNTRFEFKGKPAIPRGVILSARFVPIGTPNPIEHVTLSLEASNMAFTEK